MAHTKIASKRITAIIERENAEANHRICHQVEPLLQKEVDRLARRYRSFRGVIFGNGTYLLDFDIDSEKHLGFTASNPPSGFKRLDEMCRAASDVAPNDIRPSK